MINRVTDRARPKSGTAWSDEEHQAFLGLLSRGIPRRSIAAAIGRSENAISSRIAQHGLCKPRRPQVVEIEYPTARVPKQLVIDWYEIGWRVLGIGAADCVMEWRLERSPEYPHACRVDATPVRELEAA